MESWTVSSLLIYGEKGNILVNNHFGVFFPYVLNLKVQSFRGTIYNSDIMWSHLCPKYVLKEVNCRLVKTFQDQDIAI